MYKHKFIHVGEIYVATKPTEINTLLGSCIAICLYDRIKKISGMNHYLVPLWNNNGLQTPRFGNISIPKLIEGMLGAGCNIHNLEAKVFGGANVIDVSCEEMMIGRKNILIAQEILKEYGVPIVAQDVGGERGRRITMMSDSGKIYMKYIQKGENS